MPHFSDSAIFGCNGTASQLTPGDANGDGAVQFIDFLILARGYGETGDVNNGDFDGDGEVQFPDFLILSRNFGYIDTVPVPESQTRYTLTLLVFALALFGRRLNRSRADFFQTAS